MSLYESFQKIQDFRRGQGQRIDLASLLSIVTLGYLCGYLSKRQLSTFMRSNEPLLQQMFGLKHRMPSHVTIWTCLNQLDESQLIECFQGWANANQSSLSQEWMSAEGKGLSSTVTNEHKSSQTFTAVLSVFSQQSGLVRALEVYRHEKKSEVHVLQGLLQHFKDAGWILTMDALHCQKKQSN